MNIQDYQAIVGMPRGSIGVRCTDAEIVRIDYLPLQAELAPQTTLARETTRQLRAWLEAPSFEFDLPVASTGTPHQRQVWQAIKAIPLGRTRTYGELAKELRSAPRAIGQACGANPFPIVVPCHRVVSSTRAFNGGLGGFSHATGGYLLDIKRWLLEHEMRSECALVLCGDDVPKLEPGQRTASRLSA